MRTQTGDGRSRIVPLRATGSRPPLFFYDGDPKGGGLYARVLPAALDTEQPVYMMRPHGAFGDDVPESIEAMAAADASLIANAVPSRAYRLAGFCAGGVVALEVARRLEERGSAVDVIALVGSSATNASLEPLWALTSRFCRLFPERAHVLIYKTARSIANAVRTRSAPVEILNAIYEIRHPIDVPEPIDRIYSDRLLRYFPKPLGRTIDVIWGDRDRPKLSGDPSMGWRHVARVRRHAVGGDHKTILTDHAGEIGTALRRILDDADHHKPEG